MTDESPLSHEDAMKFIGEIVTNAGPDGISHDDLLAAYDAFISMVMAAGIVQLWHDGRVSLTWDANEQDFNIAVTETNRGKTA